MRFNFQPTVFAIFVVLLALAYAPDATAQKIHYTRELGWDLTPKSKELKLEAKQNLYGRHETLGAQAVVTVRPVIEGENREEIKFDGTAMVGKVQAVADTIGAIEKEFTDNKREYAKALAKLYGGTKLNLEGELWNFKGSGRKALEQGFEKGRSWQIQIKGKTYTLTRWGKRIEDNQRKSGVATASMTLTAYPTIKDSVLRANFKVTAPAKFDMDPLTNDAAIQKQYKAFQALFEKRAAKVLRYLNKKGTPLKRIDYEKALDMKTGETLTGTRTRRFPWYGKPRKFEVEVTATQGPPKLVDIEGALGEPLLDEDD